MTRSLRSALILLTLALGGFAIAQEKKAAAPPPAAEPQAAAAPAKEAQKAEPHGGPKEAAEEDETAQFRQSSSVKFVSRVTGTSLATAYWLCVVLNFAVIAAAIIFGMKKALPGMFRDRTAMIQKAMEEARKASEDANRRLGEIEGRLSRLDQEIAGIRAGAEQEARVEEERIRAATEEERQKVVQTTEQEIAAAARAARSDLKAYTAELAVTLAQQKIRIGAPEDRDLVRTFADQLGKDGK